MKNKIISPVAEKDTIELWGDKMKSIFNLKIYLRKIKQNKYGGRQSFTPLFAHLPPSFIQRVAYRCCRYRLEKSIKLNYEKKRK